MKPKIFQNRLNLVIAFNIFAVVITILKLFSIQVIYSSDYKEIANKQHLRKYALDAERGAIYSSDDFPLADVEVTYVLYVQPKVIDKPDQVVKAFVQVLDKKVFANKKLKDDEKKLQRLILEEKYKNRISLDLYWVLIKSNISKQQKEEIEKYKLKGVGFNEEYTRTYPELTLASHVLGFIGQDKEGQKQGYFGIEGKYDGDLRGRAGQKIEERDAQGKLILLGEGKLEPAKHGRDIYLSIDRGAQSIIESVLTNAVKEYKANSGSVIVMEPKTGRVIAMANFPTFNPSDLTEKDCKKDEPEADLISNFECREERRNVLISDIYEPGSVIKPITLSIALDLGLVNPQDTINDEGPIFASTHKIDNWNFKHLGVINMTQILQYSNNIGAAKVGQKIGKDNLYKYFERFHFNNATGIDLEGESSGYLRPLDTWRDIDLVTASFGQGISATPLQVLTAFSTIANEGNFIKPTVVDYIFDRNENKKYIISDKNQTRVLKTETADIMTQMLIKATEDGLGKTGFITRYKVAAKTGTAQIPENGEYDPSKTNTTFVGFLATNKEFSMIVKFENPKTNIYANGNAVPTWFRIAGELTDYFGIQPDY